MTRCPFGPLGVLPEFLHLDEVSVHWRFSLSLQGLLNKSKPALELAVGSPQGSFGIDAEMPGQIDHREQQIADLIRHGIRIDQ